MAQLTMDHRVSWCFGTSLAPRTGSLKGHDLWPVFFELAPLRDSKSQPSARTKFGLVGPVGGEPTAR